MNCILSQNSLAKEPIYNLTLEILLLLLLLLRIICYDHYLDFCKKHKFNIYDMFSQEQGTIWSKLTSYYIF